MYDVLVLEKFHEKVAMLCDSQPTFVIEKLEEVIAGESLQPGFVRRKLLLGVSGSESSFIYQTSIVDCGVIDEELIPTMIFAQYLSQYE
ncbi:hypothetical protein NECAME_18169, partial [Necator americanus]